MNEALANLFTLAQSHVGAAEHVTEHVEQAGTALVQGNMQAGLILLMPVISVILCGLYGIFRVRSKLPAWTTVLLLAVSFIFTCLTYRDFVVHDFAPQRVFLFHWISISWDNGQGNFLTDISLYIDSLTLLWMLFVTGLSTLIALYASEYMAGDRGYFRFFAGLSLFVLAMSCLVMADNLVLLYLGWEGVGFCSYLLIGYYYEKPSAVAAAKKAFIVNRIGDLGLALGLMTTYVQFGSIQYADIFAQIHEMQAAGQTPNFAVHAIPFLLMLGAFGKSAQLPLYVWLPDAMEGPTPVSALIHAATMVTAGVYLIARMYPLYLLTPEALTVVAWVGGLTAFFAATIGMAQYDIKRVMAYSTVSQLGYMFMGLGVMTSLGACFHVFTHAFFKALLFLACGAVMHGFAGQLDLRKLSGLWNLRGWRITSITMLLGCLALAGVPPTAGYFSKDMIIAQAFITPGQKVLGVIGILTAAMTGYYAFRVFCRVFVGPTFYEPAEPQASDHGHDFHPHAPGWAINLVLVLLAIGALFSGFVKFIGPEEEGWIGSMVQNSSAAIGHASEHHVTEAGFWANPHVWMPYIAGGTAILGILIAVYLHLINRKAADKLKSALGPIAVWAEHKWYVDEFYDYLVRLPLRTLGYVFYNIDRLLVDGLVNLGGFLPRAVGKSLQPLQNGLLQSYAITMAFGMGVLLLIAWIMMT